MAAITNGCRYGFNAWGGKRMNKPLIEARDLVLKVPVIKPNERKLLSNPSSLLKDFYLSKTQRRHMTLVDNVSLTLTQGMRLGLMGANGAGKSTLLRLLAGIYHPTTGSLKVNGSAKGLFDVSLGMHPEATGLENIYMRGLQMGLSLQEIKSLIPEVVAFAELEQDIDKPFATYSAGMKLRLAVSISTMIEPDILLLDEWVGAGDVRFRQKVTERMNRLVLQSRGLVLATHSSSLMRKVCTHAMVMDKGRVIFQGELAEAEEFYKTFLKARDAEPLKPAEC